MAESMFAGLNHICIATRDLDHAVRVWSDKYGIGPWRLYTYDATNMSASLDGKPTDFGMRVGLCQFGPATRVEIIQPLDELSPYAQSLTEHGEADHLHHIRVDVGDYDAALEHLDELGVHTVLSGTYQSADPAIRSSATYLATEADLGFMMELAHMPPGYRVPDPASVYPSDPPEAGPG